MLVTPRRAALQTPASDGDVLIDPVPELLKATIDTNRRRVAAYDLALCGMPIQEYRRAVRRGLELPVDVPLVAGGHQPEFFHCGVWAKSLVCQRLCDLLGVGGVHIVIDHDKLKVRSLPIPQVEAGRIRLSHIPLVPDSEGLYYEDLPAWDQAGVQEFADALRTTAGQRFEGSPLPRLVAGFRQAAAPRDWVGQYICGTRQVDAAFEIAISMLRSSQLDYGYYVGDLIANAHRFALCYNAALGAYRRANRIRGTRHPIPDLQVTADRAELPVWIADHQGRRGRLHVVRQDDWILLQADDELVERCRAREFAEPQTAGPLVDDLLTGRALRLRAISFTIWARLVLSDLFIHGIGGAKYDQITDAVIRTYYGVEPPEFGCVSATLWLDLPRYDVGESDLQAARQRLRDIRCNPQRHAIDTADARRLMAERGRLLADADQLRRESPRAHHRRHALFSATRKTNLRLLAHCEGQLSEAGRRLAELQWRVHTERLGRSREFYYGLFPQRRLAALRDRVAAALG